MTSQESPVPKMQKQSEAGPSGRGTAEPNPGVPLARQNVMYSLGMLAATFDEFNGKNINQYLEKFEERIRLENLTREDSALLLRFKCVGEAHNFIRSCPTLSSMTYMELKKKLLEKFGPTVLPGEHQLNLSRCYQRTDEEVSTFCTRLKILGRNVLTEDLRGCRPEEEPGIRRKNETLILNQFKVGLRRDLMKEVGMHLLKEPDLSLTRAEELTKMCEMNLRLMNNKGAPTKISNVENRSTCFSCGKTGHYARECRSQKRTGHSNHNVFCDYCGRTGHRSDFCRNMDPPGRGRHFDRGYGNHEERRDGRDRQERDQRQQPYWPNWFGIQNRNFTNNERSFPGRQTRGNQSRHNGESDRRRNVQERRSDRDQDGRRNGPIENMRDQRNGIRRNEDFRRNEGPRREQMDRHETRRNENYERNAVRRNNGRDNTRRNPGNYENRKSPTARDRQGDRSSNNNRNNHHSGAREERDNAHCLGTHRQANVVQRDTNRGRSTGAIPKRRETRAVRSPSRGSQDHLN